MATHKNLEVWKKSIDFVIDIYTTTNSYPPDEKYGLVSQIRRASVSIPSNIAEGAGRRGDKENLYFLNIALGSISEIETQLIISQKLKFIKSSELLNKLINIRQMLVSYIKYLNSLKGI